MGSTSNWGAPIRGACGAGLIHKAAKRRGITGPLRYFKEIQMGEILLLNSCFFHGKFIRFTSKKDANQKHQKRHNSGNTHPWLYQNICVRWFRSYYPYWNYWWSVFWHHQDLRIKPQHPQKTPGHRECSVSLLQSCCYIPRRSISRFTLPTQLSSLSGKP